MKQLAEESLDAEGKIQSVVRIMIFAIPFTILLNITVAIYRGFDRTNVNMYFYNIIRPISFVGFALIAVSSGASLNRIVLADLLSMIFTFLIMSVYFIKRPPFKPQLKLKFSEPTRQLIRYSFPLLITATLLNLMTWTDTVMLGYFRSAEVAGIYNAVYPLVGFLTMIINSMGFLYVPVTSKLWGEDRTESIGSVYQIMTKWCFLLTFPLFILMFVYPEFLLTRVYGIEYIKGATALRILALGFIANSYFGFNYHTLMASGDSDFLMKCSIASSATNVLLNLFLIPDYSLEGAAAASALSYISIEILMTLRTWKEQKMHPFTPMYRKLTLICILMVILMLAARYSSLLIGTTMEYTTFIIAYFMVIYYSNVLDKTEINILGEIRKATLYSIAVHAPSVFKIRA